MNRIAQSERRCLCCSHLENLDYIHGCGECAALEGETVIPTEPCICPDDVLDAVERLQAQQHSIHS